MYAGESDKAVLRKGMFLFWVEPECGLCLDSSLVPVPHMLQKSKNGRQCLVLPRPVQSNAGSTGGTNPAPDPTFTELQALGGNTCSPNNGIPK